MPKRGTPAAVPRSCRIVPICARPTGSSQALHIVLHGDVGCLYRRHRLHTEDTGQTCGHKRRPSPPRKSDEGRFICGPGGARTRTARECQRILSPLRLPIPPPGRIEAGRDAFRRTRNHRLRPPPPLRKLSPTLQDERVNIKSDTRSDHVDHVSRRSKYERRLDERQRAFR